MGETQSDSRQRLVWLLASAIAVALAAGLLIATSGLPAVCPAIYPAPASCQPGARVPFVVAGVLALLLVWIVLAVASRRVSSDRLPSTMTWLVVLLAVVFVVGLGAALFASGFVIP